MRTRGYRERGVSLFAISAASQTGEIIALVNGRSEAHDSNMAKKKRGGIGDGIKAAYHIHQALEAAQSVTASKVREFIDGTKELALMAAALVAVIVALWLVTSAITLLRAMM
jgi:hypothetical protein